MNKEKIYIQALNKWGKHSQVDMAIEEMSELTKALLKERRHGSDIGITHKICEEIADVEIMIEQLRMMYFSKNIDKYKEEKLKMLQVMVKKDK